MTPRRRDDEDGEGEDLPLPDHDNDPRTEIALLFTHLRYTNKRIAKHREDADRDIAMHSGQIESHGKRIGSLENLAFKVMVVAMLGAGFAQAAIELIKFAFHR